MLCLTNKARIFSFLSCKTTVPTLQCSLAVKLSMWTNRRDQSQASVKSLEKTILRIRFDEIFLRILQDPGLLALFREAIVHVIPESTLPQRNILTWEVLVHLDAVRANASITQHLLTVRMARKSILWKFLGQHGSTAYTIGHSNKRVTSETQICHS